MHGNDIKANSRIVPAYLGKKKENSRVLITTKHDGKGIVIEIQSSSGREKEWVTEYTRNLPEWNDARVMTGYWEAICRYIAAIYTVDSDGCLRYLILARKKDIIGEILERKNIKNGALRLDGGKLLEAEGNRYYRWESTGRKLVLVKHKRLPIPGSLQIEYQINKKGIVETPQKGYVVKPGTIIQFNRTDDNSFVEKLMFSPSQRLRTFEQLYSFLIMDRCRLEFRIIPIGYEENGQKIMIEAR